MNPRHAIVPAYLAACLLLGGASAAGFLGNMLLQLAAIVLLLAALLTRRRTPTSLTEKRLLGLIVLLISVFAVQLVPLPPDLWTALPGRQPIADGFAILGQSLPWEPLSLSPDNTAYSLLWLLPAFAGLLGILRLGAFRPGWIAWTIIGVTVVSVGIGALQVAGGSQSPWYFYRITNRGYAVGFFANNNHMATLLLASIPFLAALLVAGKGRSRRGVRNSSGLIVLTATISLVLIVGLAINTSLAGLGLAVPTVLASFLLVRLRQKSISSWLLVAVGIFAAAAIVVVFAAPLGNNLTTSEARTATDSRYTSFSRTLAASAEYFPVGSGIGTFREVYRMHENPVDVTNVYMNHAHSDLIEIALETSSAGLALILLFLIWWVRRSVAIWRAAEVDVFAKAATIASAAILAHSLVDYPLRTAAISTLFAICLALMAEPRPKASRPETSESTGRHLSAD